MGLVHLLHHRPHQAGKLRRLALQDRLAYGPTFQDALAALFEGQPSSLTSTRAQTQAPSSNQAGQPPASGAPGSTTPARAALVAAAAQDLADYQSLTAQGKLAQAGQKLEDLKRKLNQLQAGGK